MAERVSTLSAVSWNEIGRVIYTVGREARVGWIHHLAVCSSAAAGSRESTRLSILQDRTVVKLLPATCLSISVPFSIRPPGNGGHFRITLKHVEGAGTVGCCCCLVGDIGTDVRMRWSKQASQPAYTQIGVQSAKTESIYYLLSCSQQHAHAQGSLDVYYW